MGGGGHLANAATQIKDQPIADVKQQLMEIINSSDDPETAEE